MSQAKVSVKKGLARLILAATLVGQSPVFATMDMPANGQQASLGIPLKSSRGYDLSHIDENNVPLFKVTAGQITLNSKNIVQIEDEDKQDFKGTITLEPEDQFTVMSSKKLSNGSLLLRLGIDSVISNEPNVLWVHESALTSAVIEYVDDSTRITLGMADISDIENSGDEVDDDETPIATLLSGDENEQGELVRSEVAGPYRGRRHKHGRKGMTYCLRDVRVSLARMGICHSNSFGAAAANAYGPIAHQCGMRPVAYSANLPKGTVCISSGGNHRCGKNACGHAAVKIGSGAWKGAGVRPTPMLSNHGRPRCLSPR